MSDFTTDMAARMRELLARFKLPTVAAEVVRRLTDAGHHDALPTLLDVFEAEAGERAQRRTERLLKYSRLPAGKTFETIERGRLPRSVVAKLDELAAGEFLDRADTYERTKSCVAFLLPLTMKTRAPSFFMQPPPTPACGLASWRDSSGAT